MKPIQYIWIGICVIAAIYWADNATAFAAHLKNIRLGNHKAFTRIVFEFDGASTYQMPEIDGEGIASVIFPDSSVGSIIPLKNLREEYRFIDSVALSNKENNVIATIVSPCPKFEIRSFSLSNPNRVVLDFYGLKEKPAASAIVPQQPTDTIKTVEVNEEPVVLKEKAREETTGNTVMQPALQVPPSKTVSKPIVRKDKSGGKKMSDVIGNPIEPSGYDRMQAALMVLLVILNLITVAILVILTVNVLKWKRWADLIEHEPVVDSWENNVVSIDWKIQEELKKYKRTR